MLRSAGYTAARPADDHPPALCNSLLFSSSLDPFDALAALSFIFMYYRCVETFSVE